MEQLYKFGIHTDTITSEKYFAFLNGDTPLYKITFDDKITYDVYSKMYTISIILYIPCIDSFVTIKDSAIYFPYISTNKLNSNLLNDNLLNDNLLLKMIMLEYYELTGIFISFDGISYDEQDPKNPIHIKFVCRFSSFYGAYTYVLVCNNIKIDIPDIRKKCYLLKRSMISNIKNSDADLPEIQEATINGYNDIHLVDEKLPTPILYPDNFIILNYIIT
jgi:hypothetical protein